MSVLLRGLSKAPCSTITFSHLHSVKLTSLKNTSHLDMNKILEVINLAFLFTRSMLIVLPIIRCSVNLPKSYRFLYNASKYYFFYCVLLLKVFDGYKQSIKVLLPSIHPIHPYISSGFSSLEACLQMVGV